MNMGLFTKKENGKRKFIWGFKQKAIAGALAFVLVLSVGIVAIIAAPNQNARIGSRVSFTATDVAADIYMKSTHVGGGANAANVALSMSNTTAVESSDANYGTYTNKLHIVPTTGNSLPGISVDTNTTALTEMGQAKALPDGMTTYTSYVRYDFKVVNNSPRNLGVRFTYSFSNNSTVVADNNLYLNFMAKDNTGAQSATMVEANVGEGIDILATGNTSANDCVSTGYAEFTIWVNVANQSINAGTSTIYITIKLIGAEEGTGTYDGGNATESLTNTNWTWNAAPNTTTLSSGTTYNVNFTSNNEEFIGIERGSLVYVRANGTKLKVYDDTNGWINDAYKSITIVSGTAVRNATLITFIKAQGSAVAVAAKGAILEIDMDGDGEPEKYRVLSMSGNNAKLLSLKRPNTYDTFNYIDHPGWWEEDYDDENWEFPMVEFSNGESYLTYAGSGMDTDFNDPNNSYSLYYQMSSTAKAALRPTTVVQYCYGTDSADAESALATYQWIDNEYEEYGSEVTSFNFYLLGSVTVGSRYLYALSLNDVMEYLGKTSITAREMDNLMFDEDYGYDYTFALRDASTNGAWTYGGFSSIGSVAPEYVYNVAEFACPVFTLDLSQIEWSVMDSVWE